MGADIHVKVAYNDGNSWREVRFYNKKDNKFKFVDPYPFRNYELFDILSGKSQEYFPNRSIFKKDLPHSILTELNHAERTIGYYNFYEVNLADLKLFAKNHPLVPDYDAEWEDDNKIFKANPVISFIERMENYIDIAEPYWDFDNSPSKVRIIYWFDC